jgi:hypothetical protein
MDDCGTEEESTSDAVRECPALPLPPSCLTMDGKRIGFLQMCFLGACWRFNVVVIWLFVCQHAVDSMG